MQSLKELPMSKKIYNTDHPQSMASEPGIAYQASMTQIEPLHSKKYMTVDEFFDLLRKEVKKRYEEI